MSGFPEIAAVVGFVITAKDVIVLAIDIYRAVEDPSKLPKELRKVAERLPAVRDLLSAAQEQFYNKLPSKLAWQESATTLERCRDSCTELKDLLDNALPQHENTTKRVWKAIKIIASQKGQKAEDILEDIYKDLDILEKQHILTDTELLASIKATVDELKGGSSAKNQHYGSGAQNINEGSHNTIHSLSGDGNRMTNMYGSGAYYERADYRTYIDSVNIESQSRTDRIREWLTEIDPRSKHLPALRNLQDGTLDWFFTNPQFVNRLDGHYRTLWCPGDMGVGKTTLVASVYKKLCDASRSRSEVAVVYCQYADLSKFTAERVLGSILVQFCGRDNDRPQYPDALREVYEECRRHGNMAEPSMDQLEHWLGDEIRKDSGARYTVLLDGLDELEILPRADIIRAVLVRLPQQVRVLVTSRNIPQIGIDLQPCNTLRVRAHDEDLRMFLTAKLREHARDPLFRTVDNEPLTDSGYETLETEIVEKVTTNANGMFLHATMSLKLVLLCANGSEVSRRLNELPEGLHEHYHKAWNRISERSWEQQEIARLILAWLVLVQPVMSRIILQDLCKSVRGLSNSETLDPETAISWCSGLIGLADDWDCCVSLLHHSTYEYFEEYQRDYFSGTNDRIVRICLSIMNRTNAIIVPRQDCLPWTTSRREHIWQLGILFLILVSLPSQDTAYHDSWYMKRLSTGTGLDASEILEVAQSVVSYLIVYWADVIVLAAEIFSGGATPEETQKGKWLAVRQARNPDIDWCISLWFRAMNSSTVTKFRLLARISSSRQMTPFLAYQTWLIYSLFRFGPTLEVVPSLLITGYVTSYRCYNMCRVRRRAVPMSFLPERRAAQVCLLMAAVLAAGLSHSLGSIVSCSPLSHGISSSIDEQIPKLATLDFFVWLGLILLVVSHGRTLTDHRFRWDKNSDNATERQHLRAERRFMCALTSMGHFLLWCVFAAIHIVIIGSI